VGAARERYQAGLDIAKRLAAADPSNTEWQHGVTEIAAKLNDPNGDEN
jgi:hypothetical protein